MAGKKVLQDKDNYGNQRPWRQKKLENLRYAEYLSILLYKKAHKVQGCADVLRFRKLLDGSTKLYQTWFCKSRLCPLCNWRRSMKNSGQLKKIVAEAYKQQPTGRFIFLTLTERNAVDGEDLKQRLKALTQAFFKLVHYKKVVKNLLGFVRSTEITTNDNGTYHQHLHVLLFVKSSYFTGNGNNYLSQADWTDLWQKALRSSYKPIVNVEAVRANKSKGKSSLLASAQETAKYQVKSADYMTDDDNRNQQVIDDLEQALAGTRQIGYGGLLKRIKRQLKLDDADNGDLVNVDGEELPEPTEAELIVAKWDQQRKNYLIW
ncbi:protein rep [Lentilactobacillus diolivorans]|nr:MULTISPECIES: protein rep [Lactobacillaceae]MCH5465794.1 protein rep [Levilactobacillus tujiorum]MDH5107266.1 protein rep [Lentilactobacillus diolivorans]NLR13047.1 protein rep [Lactobacillus sp. HBUAS51387]GED95957.1 replication protein [Lentilactobacillus buchneri subsp. silagei]